MPCRVSEDLARAHWEKLTWNIPFNGLGVASIMGFEAVALGRPDAGKNPPALAWLPTHS